MAKGFPFPRKAGTMKHPPGYGPEQKPDAANVVAPAGPLPSEAELPITAVPGGNPAQLTGMPDQSGTTQKPAMENWPAPPLPKGRR